MATRTKAVFDASVFVRAGIRGTESAREWLNTLREGRVRVISAELCYAEIANAYVQHVRQQLIELEQAQRSLRELVRLPLDVRSNRRLCESAVRVALDAGLSAYDAHYVALAEAEDAVLVTADKALAAATTRGILLE